MAAQAEGWPQDGNLFIRRERNFGGLIKRYRARETEHSPPEVVSEATATVPVMAAEVGPLAMAKAVEAPIPGSILWMTEAEENKDRFTSDQIADLRANHGAVRRLAPET